LHAHAPALLLLLLLLLLQPLLELEPKLLAKKASPLLEEWHEPRKGAPPQSLSTWQEPPPDTTAFKGSASESSL
jgi:hypothetical protein